MDMKLTVKAMIREYIEQLYSNNVPGLTTTQIFEEKISAEPDINKSVNEPKVIEGEVDQTKVLVIALEKTSFDIGFADYLGELRNNMMVECLNPMEDADYEKAIILMKDSQQIHLYDPDLNLLEELANMNGRYHTAVKLALKALLLGKQLKLVIPKRIVAANLVQKCYVGKLKEAEAIGCELLYLDCPDCVEENNAISSILMEEDVMNAVRSGTTTIALKEGCIITPLANDKIHEFDISIRYVEG